MAGTRKAILQRGWNPLNRGCLVMPDILKTKPIRKPPPLLVTPTKAKLPRVVDESSCAAGDFCGCGNTPFTAKDTHRCKTCNGRVHGVLCCVEPTPEEEGSGPMYCLTCGRPNHSSATHASVSHVFSHLGCKTIRVHVHKSQFCQCHTRHHIVVAHRIGPTSMISLLFPI